MTSPAKGLHCAPVVIVESAIEATTLAVVVTHSRAARRLTGTRLCAGRGVGCT